MNLGSDGFREKKIAMALRVVSQSKCFEGIVTRYKHNSEVVGCEMQFHVFMPPQPNPPCLIFLSGLTCDDTNFIFKAGAIRSAAQKGICLICPDTSPRGLNIEGENESWDFGSGAGYYLDATEPQWKTNYKMFSYVHDELRGLAAIHLKIDLRRVSIFGHSMGGHGALVLALNAPGKYRSVSAFAPICNPTATPRCARAFQRYLGTDAQKWRKFDASVLASEYKGDKLDILIDQGLSDEFLKNDELKPEVFIEASKSNEKLGVQYRTHEGYDHGYYFIQTFIENHIDFHSKHLL